MRQQEMKSEDSRPVPGPAVDSTGFEEDMEIEGVTSQRRCCPSEVRDQKCLYRMRCTVQCRERPVKMMESATPTDADFHRQDPTLVNSSVPSGAAVPLMRARVLKSGVSSMTPIWADTLHEVCHVCFRKRCTASPTFVRFHRNHESRTGYCGWSIANNRSSTIR